MLAEFRIVKHKVSYSNEDVQYIAVLSTVCFQCPHELYVMNVGAHTLIKSIFQNLKSQYRNNLLTLVVLSK